MTQTINVELLLSLVESRPEIWDKTLEAYKDRNLRTAAWRDVCIILKPGFENMEQKERQDYAILIVKKWNQIRDSWMRSLKEEKNVTKSGSSVVYLKKYVYYHQLSFLKKILNPDLTHDGNTNNFRKEAGQHYSVFVDCERETYINQNENSERENFSISESQKEENSVSGAKRIKRSNIPRSNVNAMDQNYCNIIDHQIKNQQQPEQEDRNLTFFKSLLPSLKLLNDDQILEFQGSVIGLLREVKSRIYNEQTSTSNCLCQQSQNHFPQNDHVEPSPCTSTHSQAAERHNFQPSPNASTDSDLPDIKAELY